jgi:serine phosphatase RsbU (regulator of sigma subunit)
MIILERCPPERPSRANPAELIPEPADAFVLCLSVLTAGALLIAWNQHVVRRPGELLLFGLLAAAAGSQKVWVPEGARSRVSIGYVFVMLALLFLGVPEAMLIAAASGLTSSLLNVTAQPRLRESVFNISAQVLSAGLAGWTLLALGHHPGRTVTPAAIFPIFAAAVVYFLTNAVLAAGIVTLTDQRPLWKSWRRALAWTVSGALAGSSLATLMALAYRLPDRTLFYLSLPLAYGMFAAYQATLEGIEESRRRAVDLDRSARELYASFQRVGQALAAPLDTSALHRLIVDLCHDMLRPQMSGLCLWQEGALELVSARFAPSFPSGRNGSVAEALERAAATSLEWGQPTSSPPEARRPGGTEALAFAVPLQASGITHGALCVLYDPATLLSDARRQLLTSFAAHAALALQNARLFQAEQDVAETMRRSLLPPARVQARDLEIGNFYEPLAIDAGRVGGDYFDLFTLPDGRVVVTIADVCGKGLQAAVRTALSKYTVRAYATEAPAPQQVLGRANAALVAQDPDNERFTTLAYTLLDTDRNRLTLSAAGHPPGLLFRAAGRRCLCLSDGGPALGVLPDARYQQVEERFEPGDTLLLYTDGVLEARSGDEEFGLERLGREFARVADRPPHQIARALVEAVRNFAGGTLADDVTLLVIKNRRAGTDGARI